MLSNDLAWMPEDLEDTDRWIHVLDDAEIADIGRALATAKAAGADFDTLDKKNFPLDAMTETLAETLERLENGLGLSVIRGLPVDRYTKDELRLIYWGIGLHLGTAVTQSSKGDVLGDVRNFGDDVTSTSATGRGYMSSEQLGFHTDTCDVVCLFVMRTAKSGGRSMFASAVAIRDKIARTWPFLADVLEQPFYWSWKGQEPEGETLPYYQQPIYSYADGRFSSRYIKTHILSAQEFPDVPRLTQNQIAAMSAIDLLAMDRNYHYSMMFEPGDFQFINNHVTYHSRTGFEDYDEPDRKRHLLRMWLSVPNSRALDPQWTAIYNDPSAGAVRGGFPSRADRPVYETKVSEF